MITLNKKIVSSKFPNGELKVDGAAIVREMMNSVKICNDGVPRINIFWRYESDAELVEIMFIKRHIDRCRQDAKVELDIEYLPYSRMDREESRSDVFTLKYVAKFINDLKFNKVVIGECHSDVALGLIERSENKCMVTRLFKKYRDVKNINKDWDGANTVLFSPDSGAQKRYGSIDLFSRYDQAVGFKHREFSTGRILNIDILGDVKDKHVVIIDDLCSKGFTFYISAKYLLEAGAKSVDLIIAHCEESMHDGELLKTDLIGNIITSNSLLKTGHDKIMTFDI